jgi:hypothetical protein
MFFSEIRRGRLIFVTETWSARKVTGKTKAVLQHSSPSLYDGGAKELKLQTSLRESEWDPTVSDVHQLIPCLISLPMPCPV